MAPRMLKSTQQTTNPQKKRKPYFSAAAIIVALGVCAALSTSDIITFVLQGSNPSSRWIVLVALFTGGYFLLRELLPRIVISDSVDQSQKKPPITIAVVEHVFAPGAGRYGDSSESNTGEGFYLFKLKPAFKRAIVEKNILIVDLDDTHGYPASWLDTVFGQLYDDFGSEMILKHLRLKSLDEPYLIRDIESYIEDRMRAEPQ